MLIEVYGDSTQLASHYTALQDALRSKYGHQQVRVVNKGIGGLWSRIQSTGGEIPNKDEFGNPIPGVTIVEPWKTVMEKSEADIVVNNTGLNDAWQPYYGPLDHKYDFGQMYWWAKVNGKKFVIETTNPIDPRNVPGGEYRTNMVHSFVHPMIDLAEEHGLAIIDQWSTISNWYVPPAIPGGWQAHMSDPPGAVGMHPDFDLYDYKAEVSAKALADQWSILTS